MSVRNRQNSNLDTVKMKKILLLPLSCLAIASCVKNESSVPDEGLNLDNIVTSQEMEVPVKAGYVTVVKDGGREICTTGVPMSILKAKNTTPAISYVEEAQLLDYKNKGTAELVFTMCFEDSRAGDSDYNDMIVKVHQSYIFNPLNGKYSMKPYIEPIALGSANKIGLYFETFDGKVYKVAEDCRTDLFDGKQGFINTEKGGAKEDFAAVTNLPYCDLGKSPRVNWFIVTSGYKLYIAAFDHSKEYNSYVGTNGKPYGFSIPWTIFDYEFPYPAERCSVYEAYPDFGDWIDGKINMFGRKPSVKEKIYNPR